MPSTPRPPTPPDPLRSLALDPWVVVVVPLRRDVPFPVRMRRWLKLGLRAFGLRCTCLRNPTPAELVEAGEGPAESAR